MKRSGLCLPRDVKQHQVIRGYNNATDYCILLYCIVLYCFVLYCIVFIQFYSTSHSLSLKETQLTLCRSLQTEALQATASEGLAKGPYVAARARFEPTTQRSKGIDSTNAPYAIHAGCVSLCPD